MSIALNGNSSSILKDIFKFYLILFNITLLLIGLNQRLLGCFKLKIYVSNVLMIIEYKKSM